MTTVQQVLYTLESDYMGHPYYITGNALYSALAPDLDPQTRRALQVSNGVFLPGEHGEYPAGHSHSGGVPYLGTRLQPVEAYEDLFLFREPAQRWLSDTRPRDAHNTFDVRNHGGRLTVAPSKRFGRPPEARYSKRTVTWHVQCYLHGQAGSADVVPLSDEELDGLRVGGARNYGLGELSLKETQTIELSALDYSRIEAAAGEDGLQLELVSPYALTSEYPDAHDQDVPWWWATETESELRRRKEQIVKGDDVYTVEALDHGQVVTYAGDDPVQTAINGVLRVGTHSKFGFGEFRLRPASSDRVPERASTETLMSGGEA